MGGLFRRINAQWAGCDLQLSAVPISPKSENKSFYGLAHLAQYAHYLTQHENFRERTRMHIVSKLKEQCVAPDDVIETTFTVISKSLRRTALLRLSYDGGTNKGRWTVEITRRVRGRVSPECVFCCTDSIDLN